MMNKRTLSLGDLQDSYEKAARAKHAAEARLRSAERAYVTAERNEQECRVAMRLGYHVVMQ